MVCDVSVDGGLQIDDAEEGPAFAVLTSLVISPLTAGIDRRNVFLILALVMMLSGAMVAFAPNAVIFMAGRALIGVVIGGFWSMSAATVMRLVPEAQVPRGLAILNGGNALATTIAAPLGSFLGQYIGWRGAFFIVVPWLSLRSFGNSSLCRRCRTSSADAGASSRFFACAASRSGCSRS